MGLVTIALCCSWQLHCVVVIRIWRHLTKFQVLYQSMRYECKRFPTYRQDLKLLILANEMILARAELDTEWSANQRESFTKMLFEITFVALVHSFKRVDVDHHDRRIHAALMRVAQFRTNGSLAARLLMFDRFNQCTREFRRRQVGHRGGISRVDGLH